MKKILFVLPALVISLALANVTAARADSEPGYYSVSDQPDGNLLAPEELDDLLAPIALYPDPLIAQILPAATFVDQIDEAARFVRQFGVTQRIDDQPWDLSVKAVAHYPDVLYMMDQKYDWTVALGQAYLDQPQDVMDSIQALRADAQAQGNLVSTPQQQVIYAPGDIRIVPATPEYIYVPVYDPQVVYYEPGGPSYGFITFGTGLFIGAWLSRDMDWRDHRVYYHGWRGSGWVSRSRPHIKDRRSIYVSKRAATITTNRRVLQHDTTPFRQRLHQDVQRRRELPGRPAPAARPNRIRPDRPEQQRPARPEARPPRPDQSRAPGIEQRAPAAQQRPPAATQQRPPAATQQRPPAATQHPPAAAAAPPVSAPTQARPGTRDVFRGRDVQQSQPASRSGYGGYGSGKDATIYRERGQSSRQNMRQPAPAAAAPSPSPRAPAPAAPAAAAPKAAPAPAPAPRTAAPAPAARPAAPPAVRPHAPRPVMPAAPAAPRPAPPAPKAEH